MTAVHISVWSLQKTNWYMITPNCSFSSSGHFSKRIFLYECSFLLSPLPFFFLLLQLFWSVTLLSRVLISSRPRNAKHSPRILLFFLSLSLVLTLVWPLQTMGSQCCDNSSRTLRKSDGTRTLPVECELFQALPYIWAGRAQPQTHKQTKQNDLWTYPVTTLSHHSLLFMQLVLQSAITPSTMHHYTERSFTQNCIKA